MSRRTGIILRVLAIVLVAGTAVFTLLGGVGTTCIAFNAEQYGKAFAAFIPYKPTYQLFVYASLVAGIIGLAATLAIVRGHKWAYWGAVLAALAGLGTAGVHMYYSSMLKQISFFAAAPENMRFYVSALTLVVLLVLRLPRIWQGVDFALPWRGGSGKSTAGGMAAVIVGVILVTTPMWAVPNHVVDGYNFVNVLEIPLMLGGGSLILGGLGLLALAGVGVSFREARLLSGRWLASVRVQSRAG